MNLKDKVAVVAGGSGELGGAICMRLAREGAKVALTYRADHAEADEVVQAIEAISGEAMAQAVDLLDHRATAAFMHQVVHKWDRVDILVNAVGARDGATLFDMTPEQFDHVINVNLKGYFNTMSAVAPVFREQRSGKVVNVASVESIEGPGVLNDVVARSGVVGLTLAGAREMGPYDVNVNAVAPGMIETAALKDTPAESVQKAIGRSVLGRLAKPEEVADVVLFLCSGRARHITGEVIQVNGGQHL